MAQQECINSSLAFIGNSNSYSHFFPSKKPDCLSLLFEDKATLHPYKKKQTIYYEGHPALGVYCVYSGRIKVYKIGANGKPHILFIANRGDFLGIESVLAGEDFSSSGEMLEDGLVAFIYQQKFFEMIRDNIQLSLDLTDNLAKRVRISEEERVNLAEGTVRERMARALVLLGRTYGTSTKQGTLINLTLSREDLANMIGTAIGTVLRLLKEFKEEQVIELEKKHIIVKNQKYLEKVAHLP